MVNTPITDYLQKLLEEKKVPFYEYKYPNTLFWQILTGPWRAGRLSDGQDGTEFARR